MKHVTPPETALPATDRLIMDRPARLYSGPVMHQRMRPVGHRFSYRVFSLFIDLDRLEQADRLSPLFSVNKRNILAFYESDHIRGTDRIRLRDHIDDLLKQAGSDEPPAKIYLACYPRVFGRVFNPLSVFYACNADDQVTALIYQVRNTFGEDHNYVCPVTDNERSPAGLRQSRNKRFYVSPFIGQDMTYHFRMGIPGEDLKWRILETDNDGPLLSATYFGQAQPLKTGSILRNLLQIPLLTWKVTLGIHFEALRLWLKGVAYYPRSAALSRVTYGDDIPLPRPAADREV